MFKSKLGVSNFLAVVADFLLKSLHFSQSLRVRTEQSFVKQEAVDRDSRVVFKQILSFTLTEKVITKLDLFSSLTQV